METDREFTVGAHVKVRYSTDADLPRDQWPKESGVVMDDFGEQAGDATSRTWAVAHRWAVALDSGRLVFVDSDDMENA